MATYMLNNKIFSAVFAYDERHTPSTKAHYIYMGEGWGIM